MLEIIEIVNTEIDKVIQGASDMGRNVCESDLICAKVNIWIKLNKLNAR